jgi:hypothetical protein
MIQITMPCTENWNNKCYGVIFVHNEEDKRILFDELVKQDNYWKDYINIIKVKQNFDSIMELQNLCIYVGKTDIYEIKDIKKIVDFTIYQYTEQD